MKRKRRDWCVRWRLRGSPNELSIEEMRTLPREAMMLLEDGHSCFCTKVEPYVLVITRMDLVPQGSPYPYYLRVSVSGLWSRECKTWAGAKTLLELLLASKSPVYGHPPAAKWGIGPAIEAYLPPEKGRQKREESRNASRNSRRISGRRRRSRAGHDPWLATACRRAGGKSGSAGK